MDRETLRNRVISNTGRSDKADLIDDLLDDAIKEIAKAHLFRDLKEACSGTIATSEYTEALPARTRHLIEARIYLTANPEVGYHITIRDKNEFLERHPEVSGEANGIPCEGYVEGTTLYFAPPSDGAYTFKGTVYRYPAAFASDSIENPIVDSDPAVISHATWSLLASLEQFESASRWEERFLKIDLPNAIMADKRRPGEIKTLRSHAESPTMLHPQYWNHPFSGLKQGRW